MGGALGLAVLATAVLHPHRHAGGRRRVHRVQALTSGYHLAFLIGAGLVVAAILVALTVLEPTERAAERASSESREAAGEPAYSEAA